MNEGAGEPGVQVVELSGEVDLVTVEPVRAEVERLVAQGCRHVVFDLTEVTFIDSSVLALFARTQRQVDRVTVRNPSPLARRVIEVTGMASVLEVEPPS